MIRVEATAAKPNGVAASALGADGELVVSSMPRPGMPVSLDALEQAERQITAQLPSMNDMAELEDIRDKFSAIEQYARKKQLHLPALGVQRRLEARIGQLLGEAERGSNQHSVATEGSKVSKDDRSDFRLMARVLNGSIALTNDEWRQSRRALVNLVKERTVMEAVEVVPPEAAPVSKKNGAVIFVPEGEDIVDLCRLGLSLENDGLTIAEAAAKINLARYSYSICRQIVHLADNADLSPSDAATAKSALDELVRTKTAGVAWEIAESLADRVWGEGNRYELLSIAPKRLDKFERSFGIVMQACMTTDEIALPYLTNERAKKAAKQISAARAALLRFAERIKENHE